MKILYIPPAFLFVAILAAVAAAQPPTPQGATKEHEFLKKFVGEWETVTEGSAGEGQPAVKGTAVMKCSMLGSIWLVSESEMKVADLNIKAIQTIGYDEKKKMYIGTWIDSMMNHMWHYEGSVDKSGKKITLGADGPSMTGEGTSKYRDAYEFVDDDTFIATSSMLNEDGKWVTMMKGTGKRRK